MVNRSIVYMSVLLSVGDGWRFDGIYMFGLLLDIYRLSGYSSIACIMQNVNREFSELLYII